MKAVVLLATLALGFRAVSQTPPPPGFSLDYMDRSVDPKADFYHFACGSWIAKNPPPPDKSRWTGFDELQQRNWSLVHDLLAASAASKKAPPRSPKRLVGDFFRSAMDTNRIEALGLQALAPIFKRIDDVHDRRSLMTTVGWLHARGIGGEFEEGVAPDSKNSSIYAFQLGQGGLSLPDRDYYLADSFGQQRDAYLSHVAKMFVLAGEASDDARRHAATVLALETELAKASKSRVELRDPVANYNKTTYAALLRLSPNLAWDAYFDENGVSPPASVIVGQTNFLARLSALVAARPINDWKVYLRWHALRVAAPYLPARFEAESFAFFGRTLRGQLEQEPRWQRAARVIDGEIGEALGELYVKAYYPDSARARMNELVNNIRAVFQERLEKATWMSEATRRQGLAKFARFTQKIGHPDRFRDYSKIAIARDDYFGNVQRSSIAETERQLSRVGHAVDRDEWHMTPQTVNAYFNPLQNEIVFPAGILQPPFFDLDADDAVNYGAIGVVIGHEITHGYDDQGRQFDADGNLRDWWTPEDAAEFKRRAQMVVDQYSAYEALPGAHVNGELTLGENLADLGGTSIAYEALQRALAKDTSKRQPIGGFTPEQRFFLSLSQVWRATWREAELRRRLVVDPHSPAQFRGIGPHVNQAEFFSAFDIKEGDPLWRPPSARAKIW